MKWGYKYENGDLVLNEKAEGEGLTRQGLEIWCKQEAGEYRSGFGFDRNFFTASGSYVASEVAAKLGRDVYTPAELEARFELERITAEELGIKVIFE